MFKDNTGDVLFGMFVVTLLVGVLIGFLGSWFLWVMAHKPEPVGEVSSTSISMTLEREAEIDAAHEESRRIHEEAKAKWFAQNPPVEVLFDDTRIRDMEYVTQYLIKNPIAGSCALVWIPDVVCIESGMIKFPTSR